MTKSGANPLSVTSQNPNLSPYRAKTADLSFEWYYDKGALFSVAFFYKHLDDLIVTQTLNIPYENNPLGLPDSLALAACGGAFTSACNLSPHAAGCPGRKTSRGAPGAAMPAEWRW